MILEEYLTTVFLASAPDGGWPHHFHIITACNPGKMMSDDANARADEELSKELNLAGTLSFRITGFSPDLSHQEPSWGISGLSKEKALAIGKRYGQNAIFEVVFDVLSVIGCLSGERISAGAWKERVFQTISALQSIAQP
jgi:hypothetical protein